MSQQIGTSSVARGALAALLVLGTGCAPENIASDRHDESGGANRLLAATIGWGALPSTPDMNAAAVSKDNDASALLGSPVEDDQALTSSVAASRGIVAIGFRYPSSARSRASGLFRGVAKADALGWRDSLAKRGVKIFQTLRSSATVFATIDPALAPAIRALPFVDYLEASRVYSAQQFTSQIVDSAVMRVRAPTVWSVYGITGSSTNITIIDTGIDSTHYWNSSGDGPANLAYCGYVSGVGGTCYQDYVHGSAVAGIATGRNNCCGRVGVAYGPATTNVIRAGDATGHFPDYAIAAALDWATSSGFPRHIVNMSFGGCDVGSAVSDAIGRASSAGILLIAAAGNIDGNCSSTVGTTGVLYPGRFSQVVAVSGTNLDDSFATGRSRYGAEVALSAPIDGTAMGFGGYMWTTWGTSFSSPTVAGVAALVWAQNPSWSANSVLTRLEQTAVDNYTPGRDYYFGFGRVSAYNATQTPFAATASGPLLITSAGTYSWSASAYGASTPYSYVWAYKNVGSSTWTDFATGTSGSRSITASTPSFDVRATVSSPTWEGTVSAKLSVTVQIGGGCSPYCE
jgi:subtilisin family serine protease